MAPNPHSGSITNDENASLAADEIKTVFHDVNNFNVKHPLLNTWSLWVSRNVSVRMFRMLTLKSSLSHHLRKVTTGTTC